MGSLRDALVGTGLASAHQAAKINGETTDASTLAAQQEEKMRLRMSEAANLNDFRKTAIKSIAESPEMIDEALKQVVRFNHLDGGKKLAVQLVATKTEMEEQEFDSSNPERLEKWLRFKLS